MIAETESSGCRLTKWGFGKMENCETGKACEIEPVLFCSVRDDANLALRSDKQLSLRHSFCLNSL